MLFGACMNNGGKEKLAGSQKSVRVITDPPALPCPTFLSLLSLFLIEDDCPPEGDFQTHGLDGAISLYL